MTAGWGRRGSSAAPGSTTLRTLVMSWEGHVRRIMKNTTMWFIYGKDTWARTSQTGGRGCDFCESGRVSAAVEAESLLNCAAATRRPVARSLSARVPV